MPRLTRWFLRAGLLYLVAALALGVAQRWPGRGPAILAATWPVYIHALVVGWLTQLVFGVAWWMFPRAPGPRPRGSARAGWIVFVALNAGLLLRLGAEPAAAVHSSTAIRWALAAAAVLQLLAGWLFVVSIWPRVRGR